MKYTKPDVMNSNGIKGAVCGSGPCGRPCNKKA